MYRDEKENKFREYIQKELNEEADKPADEINTERIEMLVKLLDTYDDNKEKNNSSDYDEFLERFNYKNGLNLQSSNSRKKNRVKLCNKYFTFRLSYRVIAVALILILGVTVSNEAVKASTDKSILSWLSEAKDSVVFELKNTNYEGWISDDKESEKETGMDYYLDNYMINPDDFEDMEVTTTELEFDEIDWCKTLKLNYVPDGFEAETVQMVEFGENAGALDILYRSPNEKGYISLFVQQLDIEEAQNFKQTCIGTKYDRSVDYNDFVAYIFTGEENNQAFFAVDGKMYSINTTLDEDTLCDMIEKMAYEK